MQIWSVPKLWDGATCAVLGSGPSMTPAVAEQLRGRCYVIAVNNQGIPTVDSRNRKLMPAMAPWADVLYASDANWWFENRKHIVGFSGLMVSVMPRSHTNPNYPEELDVKLVGNSGSAGYDDDPSFIRTGYNSGYAAVHLAAKLGAIRVLLCGFDMRVVNNSEHWFGSHLWAQGRNLSRFATFMKAFESGAPEFKKRGVEIINCTPGSALKCFPNKPLAEVLDGLQDVSTTTQQIYSKDSSTAVGMVGEEVRTEAGTGVGIEAGANA